MLPIKIIDGNLNYEATVTWELKTHTLILSSIVSPYVYNVYNIIRRMLQRLMTSTTTNIASVLYYILIIQNLQISRSRKINK